MLTVQKSFEEIKLNGLWKQRLDIYRSESTGCGRMRRKQRGSHRSQVGLRGKNQWFSQTGLKYDLADLRETDRHRLH
ncbi:hypothetical protein PGTUg99_004551 [Puccinia graminis f. sp. tritici]|uniref:Uncharacterized protein n=1 Tax=Puccinia graminis f. sp. tritici TaxID=56615 RepID=A0A5B0PSL9_PUCGR|nr:hypothetical protein PGTUg99_004551 [Puccinia graminis f. sp. tritici]